MAAFIIIDDRPLARLANRMLLEKRGISSLLKRIQAIALRNGWRSIMLKHSSWILIFPA